MKTFDQITSDVRRAKPDPLVALENLEREVSDLVADVRRGRFVQDDGCLLGNVVEYGNETLEAIAALRGDSE